MRFQLKLSFKYKIMGSRIIQVNLQKCLLAKECLVKDVWTWNKPAIAIVQEPYIGNSGRPMGIPNSFGLPSMEVVFQGPQSSPTNVTFFSAPSILEGM